MGICDLDPCQVSFLISPVKLLPKFVVIQMVSPFNFNSDLLWFFVVAVFVIAWCGLLHLSLVLFPHLRSSDLSGVGSFPFSAVFNFPIVLFFNWPYIIHRFDLRLNVACHNLVCLEGLVHLFDLNVRVVTGILLSWDDLQLVVGLKRLQFWI